MIERIKQKRQNEEGFTLVELLVVIVILGILAAIVVFAVGGITDKGDDAAKDTDIAVLQSAEEAQFANTKTNPLYVGEQDLVDGKFLRALSTKHDICLMTDDSGTATVDEAGTDYKVVTAPASTTSTDPGYCGTRYAPAP